MSLELINKAIATGAQIYASVSGGKDGDAMVESLVKNGYAIAGLVHADLGRVEWPESLPQCKKCSYQFNIPLHVVTRADKRDLLDHWKARLVKVAGTGKPFWSSKANRYCTSDLKRDPIDRFFTSCPDFIISAEGIRAEESTDRSKKQPLAIRWTKTSTHYKNMTVEEAIAAYRPGKRLTLTWYPIFNFTLGEVWATKGMSPEHLEIAREYYRVSGEVPSWWPFHAAYAYGNDRVSCMFCIMGSLNDLTVGARHNPQLLDEMIDMEKKGCATFKSKWSLQELKTIS